MPAVLVSEDEYYAACEAVMEGLAVDLMRCYMCEPDVNKRFGAENEARWPLRGVISERTVEAHRDPTACYTLSCGHSII